MDIIQINEVLAKIKKQPVEILERTTGLSMTKKELKDFATEIRNAVIDECIEKTKEVQKGCSTVLGVKDTQCVMIELESLKEE